MNYIKNHLELLLKELESYPTAKIIATEDQILNRTEAAELLKISPPTLDRYVELGEIPSFKIGHSRRFRKSDLLNIGKS